MNYPDLQYISDEAGNKKAVIIPISIWQEIEAQNETAFLLKSKKMHKRLLEAKNRQEGISYEEAIQKLGI